MENPMRTADRMTHRLSGSAPMQPFLPILTFIDLLTWQDDSPCQVRRPWESKNTPIVA